MGCCGRYWIIDAVMLLWILRYVEFNNRKIREIKMNELWWVFIIEGLVTTILGSVLHFTYEWTGQNKFVAYFAAVNESTWEHIKLALSSIFFCTLFDVWFLGSNSNYWFAKSISFLVPIVVIPVLFYGYRAILKVKSCLPIDITIFCIGAFASSGVFALLLAAEPLGEGGETTSMMVMVVVLVFYLLLTKFPAHNFLFKDPVTGKYGIEASKKRKASRRSSKTRK